eukprot:5939429-Ditylum_brightwellii.AAC.1
MTEVAASTRLGLNKEQTNTFFTSFRQMEALKEMLVQLGQEGCREAQAPGRLNEESGQEARE